MEGSRITDIEVDRKRSGVLSWFISPHGFGHAARASAVVAEISRLCFGIRHHLFTTVPQAFFDDRRTRRTVRSAVSLGLPPKTILVAPGRAAQSATKEI